MNIRNAIKESYIINLLLMLKRLSSKSFIFSIHREDNNSKSFSREYKPWTEYSLIYSLLMKLDSLFRKVEMHIYDSCEKSKILGAFIKFRNRDKKGDNFKSPILKNSRVVMYSKNFVADSGLKNILVSLVALYIFVDYIIRNIGFLQSFSSIWDELFLVILFAYIVYIRIISRGTIKYNFTPMGLPAAIFIILGITHVMIVAPELPVAIEGFRAVFQQIFWYFAITQLVRDTDDSKKVINLMIGMGLFLGLHATYQYIAGVPMPGNWVDVTENVRTRAYSIVGSPNILGCLFVLLIPVTCSMLIATKNKSLKIFYSVTALFMLLGLFFTMSRGAWLAFAFSVGIFILIINPKLIIPFIALGGAFIVFGGSLSERLLYIFSPTYLMKSAAGGRLYRWEVGLNVWRKSKLFGAGLGRFGGAVAINNKLAPFYLDNYYLKTLTEMGIYGITGFVFVIICFVIFSGKIIRHQNNPEKKLISIGLFTGAAGVLVQCFVENIFEVPAMEIYFWVFVALINTFAPKLKPNQIRKRRGSI